MQKNTEHTRCVLLHIVFAYCCISFCIFFISNAIFCIFCYCMQYAKHAGIISHNYFAYYSAYCCILFYISIQI